MAEALDLLHPIINQKIIAIVSRQRMATGSSIAIRRPWLYRLFSYWSPSISQKTRRSFWCWPCNPHLTINRSRYRNYSPTLINTYYKPVTRELMEITIKSLPGCDYSFNTWPSWFNYSELHILDNPQLRSLSSWALSDRVCSVRIKRCAFSLSK